MKRKTKRVPKKTKAERRRGLLAGNNRLTRIVTTLVLAVVCVALTFTQLGFVGFGFPGAYKAYIFVLLLPVALTALLLGTLTGMLMGLFAGTALFVHASLMPLDFYEMTFVTPLTSIIMLGVAGLLLGLLFSFALRNDPSPIRSGVYIAIVCILVSWLYSIGFLVNVLISMLFNVVSEATAGTTQSEVTLATQRQVMAIALRMGSISLQAWVDALLMAICCISAKAIAAKAKLLAGNKGLRGMFAVRLSIVVFVAFMLSSSAAFVAFTMGELSDAAKKMDNEVSYLWSQIDHAGERAVETTGLLGYMDAGSLTEEQLGKVMESISINTLLDGYSSDADGTILVLLSVDDDEEPDKKFYAVALSDDDRFQVGQDLDDCANLEVVTAIEHSVLTDKVTRAVFDENHIQSFDDLTVDDGKAIQSEIVYLLARQQDDCTVVMMLPARDVFASRGSIMGWTALSAFILLAAVFVMVFLLLDRAIVRRIDETNDVLARITQGDLDAVVDVRDTREFASLSDGVNETVGALKGWIAEAESRIDAELATAKAIQESALPRTFPPFPDIPKFDVYASMNAAREIGGDFYDFFLINDSAPDEGKLCFIVADVSGKGVPAALFMMKATTQLRDFLKTGMDVGEAVGHANQQLCEGNDEGMFVTAWIGVLDYATGHVDFVNAGHNPPLIWKNEAADCKWEWLTEKSGLPLGLFDGLPYETHSLECDAGDKFLLYSDGVTEAMSVKDELYGEDRLEALANENGSLHPQQLVETVRHDVAIWAEGAEQSDDITILVLEVGTAPEQ